MDSRRYSNSSGTHGRNKYLECIFAGAHLTFLSVLSASMGFSRYLSDNSKELAPLCGLLEGCGEVIGRNDGMPRDSATSL